MAEAEALKNMVLSFRVSELQMLLGFAGRNKSGRKTELQARAVELLRLRSTPVQMKIKDLYKSIQQGQNSGMMPMQQGNPTATGTTTTAGATPARDMQSVHTTGMPQHTQPQQRSTVYQPTGYSNAVASQPPRNIYPNNMYQYQPKASAPTSASSNYPVHPDVRLKRLPFFDLMGELLKPSSLIAQGTQRLQEANFVFHLTPQQATDVASSRDLRPGSKMEYAIQVQMRFCLLETSCEQDDFFPPGICVKVNGKMCPLPNPIPTNKPGVEPKRPPRPVNITTLVKLSPTVANHITVSWNAEYGRGYCIAVYLVRKLTSTELLQRLKTRGVRHSDFTRGLIKEKLSEDADCEIATTSLRVSLVCPLGKMRMTTPCRASTCYHLQCFDASLYLQMNERKPTWMCPVCDKPALYDNLVIDGYFQQVLNSGKLSIDGNEIQLHQDGSWSSLIVKKDQTAILSPVSQDKSAVKIETVSDDLEKTGQNISILDITGNKTELFAIESTVAELTENNGLNVSSAPIENGLNDLTGRIENPTATGNSSGSGDICSASQDNEDSSDVEILHCSVQDNCIEISDDEEETEELLFSESETSSEDDDSDDDYRPPSREEEPRRKVSREMKMRAVELHKKHPDWSVKSFQRNGCQFVRKKQVVVRWAEQFEKGDSKYDMLTKIRTKTYEQYKAAIRKNKRVMDKDLLKWARAAAREFKGKGLNFKASHSWVTNFKKAHNISLKKQKL